MAAGALRPLLNSRQRIIHMLAVAGWIAAAAYFWTWWLDPLHVISTKFFVLNTAVLVWAGVAPLYLMLLYTRANVTRQEAEIPAGRVAMVVTKAPAEPWTVVRETLEAMRAQDYPHDTWLADEDPAPETIRWCRANGIKISTRKGIADYHRKTWPRRTRCKEGNLAYFYDHYGYDQYDFVVQLDADHVPAPGYLREMLKPFADPKVGYVSAPSICDKNADRSWSARGRLNMEGTVHGLLQAAYSNGWAPLCIGSHYAVRTAALKEIGGLGPELAEDHSTSLMMNAHGWRGVHAINAIAHGDGPCTFADLVVQEFQWSRSLMTILLRYTPHYIGRLPPRLKFQFVFCQLWYPLFSLFMLAMFLMPILALTQDVTFANVSFLDFLMYALPAEIILVLLAYQWKANGWFRPHNARVFSWEGILFLHARWPWTLAGSLVAIYDRIRGGFVDFRVTPKSKDGVTHLPARIYFVYCALALAPGLSVILCTDVMFATGFYFFGLINCSIYSILLVVIVYKHAEENNLTWNAAPVFVRARYAGCASLMVLPLLGLVLRGPDALDGVTWNSKYPVFVSTYTTSGAGQRSVRARHARLVFLRSVH